MPSEEDPENMVTSRFKKSISPIVLENEALEKEMDLEQSNRIINPIEVIEIDDEQFYN